MLLHVLYLSSPDTGNTPHKNAGVSLSASIKREMERLVHERQGKWLKNGPSGVFLLHEHDDRSEQGGEGPSVGEARVRGFQVTDSHHPTERAAIHSYTAGDFDKADDQPECHRHNPSPRGGGDRAQDVFISL